MIRAGQFTEAVWDSGEWLIVDMGFAQSSRSCGVLLHDGLPEEVTFSEATRRVIKAAQQPTGPLNLLIEAPLSVAFLPNGNPTGRVGERRGSVTRYWYVGLGSSVMVAAAYLLRSVLDSSPRRDIRLFEGLASFKDKGVLSSHANDVLALRDLVRREPGAAGSILAAEDIAASPDHVVFSAFRVAGMDFGVPPVIIIGS